MANEMLNFGQRMHTTDWHLKFGVSVSNTMGLAEGLYTKLTNVQNQVGAIQVTFCSLAPFLVLRHSQLSSFLPLHLLPLSFSLPARLAALLFAFARTMKLKSTTTMYGHTTSD